MLHSLFDKKNELNIRLPLHQACHQVFVFDFTTFSIKQFLKKKQNNGRGSVKEEMVQLTSVSKTTGSSSCSWSRATVITVDSTATSVEGDSTVARSNKVSGGLAWAHQSRGSLRRSHESWRSCANKRNDQEIFIYCTNKCARVGVTKPAHVTTNTQISLPAAGPTKLDGPVPVIKFCVTTFI